MIALNDRRSRNKLIGLLNATGYPGTLPVRSLILLHDILECLLVEVAARLVLGGLVDGLGAARGMRNHEVLLIARSRDLRLHLDVVRLGHVLLLLAQTHDYLVNNLVGWVLRLPASWNLI